MELIEEFYNNVTWRQFHAMLGNKPFPNKLSLIEKTFKISAEEVIDMIDGLTRLGLIKQEDHEIKVLKLQ